MSRLANCEVYLPGTTAALIGTDRVTPPTAAALRRRLLPLILPIPGVLDARQLALLTAVAARLIPQAAHTSAVDLAGTIHRRLADEEGIGWRYADLPPAADAARRGLDALDASAGMIFGSGFIALDGGAQDEVLRAVQFGRAGGDGWAGMNPVHWFNDLLAALVDIYYSHPAALDEIGYAGFADARGWQDVAIDARGPHEPVPHGPSPS